MAESTIAGIERAMDVLDLFVSGGRPDLGVTEIAEQLGLSKAVVHRILTTLKVKGYVSTDEETRRYRLGANALRLGLSYLDRLDVQDVARTALRELVARTDETATQSIRAGWQRVYVAQVTPRRDIKMMVQLGATYPLHAGASSRAILAFLSPELREAYAASGPLDRLTDRTITSKRELDDELARVRERGYALSLGERQEGAASVAAPVFDHTGQVVSSLSVCGPVERFAAEAGRCAEVLLDVTARVSRDLGHRAG